MSIEHPNFLEVSGPGERRYAANFGTMNSAYPKPHVAGLGHIEHVEIHCEAGIFMRLTADEAARWARKILVALTKVPDFPDCSGALAFIPGGDQ